eukprot:348566_1
MSENNTMSDTPKSTPTKEYDNNEDTNLNANITEAADMSPPGIQTCDNMQTTMAEEQIKRNEQTIKELDEEAKEKEKKETKLMNRKNPDFSLGWTIGDSRWYMMLFQLVVVAVSGFVLVVTYSQMPLNSQKK